MKSKYETHIEPHFDIILGYLRSGYTEASIAKRLGVGVSTWEKYKKEHIEFLEVIKTGRQDIGALAVNNLKKLADGYDYEEIHTEIVDSGAVKTDKDKNKRGAQRRVIKKITRHVPPNLGANIFIVLNRMKERWKNKQEIKHSGQVRTSGVLMTGVPLSREAWLQFYKDNVENANPSNGQEPT